MAKTLHPSSFCSRIEEKLNMSSYKVKNSTIIMRVMCAILFLVFTFSYLFYYQADILAVGQHVLSKGQTRYDRTIGALLITTVLYMVQLVVLAITKYGYFH